MAKKKGKNDKWTKEMVDKLRNHYPCDSWSDLEQRFKISKSSLMTTACKFGIKRERSGYSTYSKQEDEMIINYYNQGLTDEEISKAMPWRTASSINSRRSRIGATKPMVWTAEEEDFLIKNYSIMPAKEIEKYLPGRTRNAIVSHAVNLGLTGYRDYDYYTNNDLDFIKDNYLTMTDAEIGNILNHPAASIKNHRNRMGLHRVNKKEINYESFDLYFRRHNYDWKKKSMENCSYKCVLTGDRFDDIHHLMSQNTIIETVLNKWNIEKSDFNINALSEEERYLFLSDVLTEQSKYPLGICLRHDVHKQFHDLYGFGNNTPEQFYKFVERYYPDVQLNIA